MQVSTEGQERVPVSDLGDTGQSGVVAGAESGSSGCAELLSCASRCGEDEACGDGCVERASEASVSQLRTLFVCLSQCDEAEDSDACSEQNCIEPLVTCFGGRQVSDETSMALRTALVGRALSHTETWTDSGSGSVGFATETQTTITLCPSGQFYFQASTQSFASGNIGDESHSAMTDDDVSAQGQWQVYALGTTQVLELARTDGRTEIRTIAVQDGALYLDGEHYDVSATSDCQ